MNYMEDEVDIADVDKGNYVQFYDGTLEEVKSDGTIEPELNDPNQTYRYFINDSEYTRDGQLVEQDGSKDISEDTKRDLQIIKIISNPLEIRIIKLEERIAKIEEWIDAGPIQRIRRR